MELGFKNLNTKTIAKIVMEKLNFEAQEIKREKGDWIFYLYSGKYYYLKSAIMTQTEKFNFSISENIRENIYCICLVGNELHVFQISGITSEKKIVLNNKFEFVPKNPSLTKIKECSIVIDNLDYWELQQDNDERIKSLATVDRLMRTSGKFETKEIFLDWYNNQEKKCCYCGVKEKDLKEYFNQNNKQYKEARQRGQYLEIERIVTAPKNKNVYSEDNCALVCYICNNAKSDFLSPINFKPIAKGINEFWNNILNNNVVFPEESPIWSLC